MSRESEPTVRTALRAVLGRLGQASVPLIQSFSVQALHRRTRDGPPYLMKSRRLEPWVRTALRAVLGRLGQASVPFDE